VPHDIYIDIGDTIMTWPHPPEPVWESVVGLYAARAEEWGDKIPIGTIYRQERPLYEDSLPQLKAGPLVKQVIKPEKVRGLVG
jgi:hypothetical protein